MNELMALFSSVLRRNVQRPAKPAGAARLDDGCSVCDGYDALLAFETDCDARWFYERRRLKD